MVVVYDYKVVIKIPLCCAWMSRSGGGRQLLLCQHTRFGREAGLNTTTHTLYTLIPLIYAIYIYYILHNSIFNVMFQYFIEYRSFMALESIFISQFTSLHSSDRGHIAYWRSGRSKWNHWQIFDIYFSAKVYKYSQTCIKITIIKT